MTTVVDEDTTLLYVEGELVASEEGYVSTEEELIKLRSFSTRQLSEDEAWMLVPEYIQEREWPLFQTMNDYFMRQFTIYCNVKGNNLQSYDKDKDWWWKNLSKNVGDSDLFLRLIQGKKPQRIAPPKSYGHYWYDLVDDGVAFCIEVTFSTYNAVKWIAGKQVTSLGTVRIDSEEWNILKRENKDESDEWAIVQWKDTDHIYKLSRITKEDAELLLHPRLRKLSTKSMFSWKLERVESTDDTDN